jgi:drug/metabolite transporter (DMT)-like permease
VYILVSEGLARRERPQVLAALVCTGAAVALTVGSAALGDLRPGALTAAGWGWLACLAVVSTVVALNLFFAGLRRVGPTTASILATVEPLMTVLLAFAVFGERLAAVQIAGGGLVLAAVLALRLRRSANPAVEAAGDALVAVAPAVRVLPGQLGRRSVGQHRPPARRPVDQVRAVAEGDPVEHG